MGSQMKRVKVFPLYP